MPRKRSRQSRWMKTSQNVNWRGQRPKFNPSELPDPASLPNQIRAKGWTQPAIEVEIRRQEILEEGTFESSKARLETRLLLDLKRRGGD